MGEMERPFEIVTTFDEAEESDRTYYWSLTPAQRLAIVEELRRRNYGEAACETPMQKHFLEIVELRSC